MCDHISLLLPNRPGEFLRVAKLIENAGINILGYQLTSEGNTGVLHVLCSSHSTAYQALFQKYHFYCNQASVLICPVEHNPGQLRQILDVLHRKHLNVEMAYQAIDSNMCPLQVFQLTDREKTEEAQKFLTTSGIDVLSEQPA